MATRKLVKDIPNNIKRTVDVSSESSEYPKLFNQFELPIPPVAFTIVSFVFKLALLYYAVSVAYDIRTIAIKEYGMVIHEFDPWFNYRATEYLEANGWEKFFKWFDYMSWYPLGRPVGTTIYPGMQLTAVAIYRTLAAYGFPMSLNDVCCMIPVWFGVVATLFLGLLTYESTGSVNASVVATFIMSMIPAHIMRSVGGGYDNESIAVSALVATFYFWVLSLRSDNSWVFGILTGLSYIYMVAAWGGYIFVLNMITLHAGVLLVVSQLRGKHSHSLNLAYSLFYCIGTFGAIFVPVVGWTPFKSLEQLGSLVLLIIFQLFEIATYLSRQQGYEPLSKEDRRVKLKVFGIAVLTGIFMVMFVTPEGYFGPISSRVRGLFLQHTRTGNPLVDSVAEHQPGTAKDYERMLLNVYGLVPIGLVFLFLNRTKIWQSSFLLLYTIIAFYFATKMSRLMLLLSPVGSALGGLAVASIFDWVWNQILVFPHSNLITSNPKVAVTSDANRDKKKAKHVEKSFFDPIVEQYDRIVDFYYSPTGYKIRLGVVAVIIIFSLTSLNVGKFQEKCYWTAAGHSHPMILFKHNGRIIDDYRDSYFFLRDKTPADSRVMAWWDYGYQITGIGNRTTIADGNTWNHEHIATLGYCLTSPVARSHELIRHLADYVLVWSGEHQGDLGKSPHMARIGNSVYHDICPTDPTCSQFGFFEENGKTKPTPMMQKSLLYNLIKSGESPDAYVDPRYYKLAYVSENRLVKIYQVMDVSKESKEWCADPANRVCDAPGSWYCVGQYPPAKPIQDLMKKKTDFAQLEDFNRKGVNAKQAEKYQEEYMEKMAGQKKKSH